MHYSRRCRHSCCKTGLQQIAAGRGFPVEHLSGDEQDKDKEQPILLPPPAVKAAFRLSIDVSHENAKYLYICNIIN